MSHSLSLSHKSVLAVLTLLDEGCTIPFISRYRKERTGNLDEVQITNISELNDRLKELGKRKETILKTIREQEKLTPELEAKILACMDSTELEDIYLPYKPKRRTRAQIAREQGLEPLALAIMKGASPNLPERGGVPMRTREDKGALNLPQHLSKVSASLSPPPSGRSGGALEASLRDILTELEKPGRDPRGEVEVFEFDKNIHTLNDLIVGMELPGIVTNITNFGVFVDIGVHQDGLVHISQLSDRFVTDPTQVIRLHQHVRVRVVEVDMHRKRIGLSMKNIKQ
ncbi:S1 RNA-binding domain-containing protein [Prevotella histicola]|nr:S1 RNA-binding domain-containing protein [Prevotella histicola]MBW4876951.1 S1 RNA-binding domain-containing protein [Prevotella histicola]MBW4920453.1 S1 RNA-binding domain-containing protein [Prevotella histicola]